VLPLSPSVQISFIANWITVGITGCCSFLCKKLQCCGDQ